MIKPTFDINLVKQIMVGAEIFDHVVEDNVSINDVSESNFTNKGWVVYCDENEKIKGLLAIETLNNSSIRIHPYLLPEYRKQGIGKEFMKEFYEFFLSECPKHFIKIDCRIPKCFSETYKFAKKVGFKDEGIDRQSYTKYGSVWDQYYLGITRAEIEEWIASWASSTIQ